MLHKLRDDLYETNDYSYDVDVATSQVMLYVMELGKRDDHVILRDHFKN